MPQKEFRETYDPVEHLARIGAEDRWGERYLVMLTAVFDASGSEHDQEWLVVAGYAANAASWSRFSPDWLTAIAPEILFHATQWRHRLKDAYETDPTILSLVDLIHTLRYRCACIVRIQDFKSLSSAARMAYRINAYVLAARTCVSELGEFCFHRGIPRHEIEWVFESGDVGEKDFLNLMIDEGMPRPIFKSKKDIVSKKTGAVLSRAFTPLQSADFYAHESFRANKYAVAEPRLLQQLEVLPGKVSVWEPNNLVDLGNMLNDITSGSFGSRLTGF